VLDERSDDLSDTLRRHCVSYDTQHKDRTTFQTSMLVTECACPRNRNPALLLP